MLAENPAGQTILTGFPVATDANRTSDPDNSIRTGSSRAQEQYPATPLGTGVPVIIEGLPPSSGVIDE
jgi:hypothetical protein